MVTYKEVAQKTVEREMEVIGKELAMRVAKETDNLDIDDEGNISRLGENKKDIIDKLVAGYQDITGDIAVSIIARAIKDIGGDELDLPERLENRM